MTEADACGGGVAAALEEEAAGIICSLRAGDLAGWTPPWRSTPAPAPTTKDEEEQKAWPAVTRGKRSRSSRRRSPSGSVSGSAAKGRWARGSPASPLDYSCGVSGSGASTSGGEDGAFCSPPAPAVARAHAGTSTAATTPPSSSAKHDSSRFFLVQQVASAGARRALILPVPATVLQPRPAGQRSRKKMRLPEVQQLVQSLAAENDGLRQEMQSLRRACTSLSKENSTLETRLEHTSSSKRKRIGSEEQQQQAKPRASERNAATNGFVLPDLNIPAQDITDGSAVAAP
ncbi:uncharacterized protein LOC124664757 [Lolium rigidum]|uniref:uncharacterized protein LOC124664757 n=1 Tax=Lolium rigidum TaxID=89674 RepID=UPI001F5CA535|nr:uncharacterized protein LOC124664757 [Lolium rigidum]